MVRQAEPKAHAAKVKGAGAETQSWNLECPGFRSRGPGPETAAAAVLGVSYREEDVVGKS